MDDKILLAASYNGVSLDLFIHKLYDQEPQTMAELIYSAQSFINVEDAILPRRRRRRTTGKWLYTPSRTRSSSKESQNKGEKEL